MSFSPDKSGILNLSRRHHDAFPDFRLQGRTVPRVVKLKTLGLFIQEGIHWKEHLEYIKARVLKRISLIRFIGNPCWGLNGDQLLKIFSITVLPILLYASPILFSAPSYFRNGLRILHSAGLRACLGLPIQTPLTILQCISGRIDLETHFHLSIMRFLFKHQALGDNSPLADLIQNREALTFYKWGTTNIPLLQFLNHHERSGLVNLSQIRQQIFYAPSFLPRFYQIHLRSLPFQRKDLPPPVIRGLFQDYLQMLSDHTILVGTDASKKLHLCAIGITSNTGFQSSQRVPETFSIFSAEAVALLEAITNLPTPGSSWCFFSDSLSVLSALAKTHRGSHTLILDIHNRMNHLVEQGIQAQIVWTPGHSGIDINEMADRAAAQGLTSTQVTNFKIPWTDSFRSLKGHLLNNIRESWMKSHYHNSFPHLQPLSPWKPPEGFSRRAEIHMNKFRADILPLNTKLFLWKKLTSPMCHTCNALETPEHYFLKCSAFTAYRSQLFRALQLSPTVDIQELLKFSGNACSPRHAWELWNYICKTRRFF